MSIDRLRYFAAVVETRHLRKASEMVGISPPSMSKAISVLESELGHKLIHPEGRGIGITAKGLEIYRQATSLLDGYRKFHQNVKAGTAPARSFRIATFEVFSSYFIASFLSDNRALEFSLFEMTPGKIESAILTDSVDCGITYLPSPDPALEYKEIGSFEMGIFGRKTWDGIEFARWPFAIPVTEPRIPSSEFDSLDMWPRSAPKRLVKYQFELLETALQTSRKGLSVLHCPDFIVSLHNEDMKAALHLSPLTPPPGYKRLRAMRVYLVGRKGSGDMDLERKLAKFMRTLR